MPSKIKSISLEEYNQLIGHIYDASLDVSRWPRVLEEMSKALNTKSGMLRIQDMQELKVLGNYSYNQDSWYQKQYADYFVQCDPIVKKLLILEEGYIGQTETGLPKKEYRKSEYFNDYAKPQDHIHMCGGLIAKNNSRVALLGIQRNEAMGPYSDDEIYLLKILYPHLRRAVDINSIVGTMFSQVDIASGMLDKLATGVILVDSSGSPVFVNKKAEMIFSEYDGFEISQNCIALPRHADTNELHKLIFEASKPDGMKVGGHLSVLTSTQFMPVSIIITPVHSASTIGQGLGLSDISAILYFDTKVNSSRDMALEILQLLYGLTTAEARLVDSLCNGQSLDDMSTEMNVSKETLRTHLKACFKKTGTNKQVDLVRLVLSGPASLVVSSS